MPGNDEWEKFKGQITWGEVNTRNVRDGIGREFNWTKLKGKTIYICGHGGHIWYDGFCTVPDNTTINFYQPYGIVLIAHTLAGFIKGTVKWVPERSFRAGQSCPNMTLFDDDKEWFESGNNAIRERLKTSDDKFDLFEKIDFEDKLPTIPKKFDYFIFNCNQFKELRKYFPPGANNNANNNFFVGRQYLKLKDMLEVLKGNTIEWGCCQEVTEKRDSIIEQMEASEKKRARIDYSGVSPGVVQGLKGVMWLNAHLSTGYNKNTITSNFMVSYLQVSGTYFGEWGKKEVNKGGKEVIWEYKGRSHPSNTRIETLTPDLAHAKEATDFAAAREKVKGLQKQIKEGLKAITEEPQPLNAADKLAKAREVMERGLLVSENYLRAIMKYT